MEKNSLASNEVVVYRGVNPPPRKVKKIKFIKSKNIYRTIYEKQ